MKRDAIPALQKRCGCTPCERCSEEEARLRREATASRVVHKVAARADEARTLQRIVTWLHARATQNRTEAEHESDEETAHALFLMAAECDLLIHAIEDGSWQEHEDERRSEAVQLGATVGRLRAEKRRLER